MAEQCDSATDLFPHLAPITLTLMISGSVPLLLGYETGSMDWMVTGAVISVTGFLASISVMAFDKLAKRNGGVA